MSISYFNKSSVEKWFSDDGDNTHRLNYRLNSDSVVFDLGGYKGGWTDSIFKRFGCLVYVFEPVREHYLGIAGRFVGYPKIVPLNFGLGSKNLKQNIYLNGASSSLSPQGSGVEEAEFVRIDDFMREKNIWRVDLIKINIEGGEYELLEHILDSGLQERFSNIQVQFHKMFPDSPDRRAAIRSRLSETHRLTYDYDFVWENWEILSPC